MIMDRIIQYVPMIHLLDALDFNQLGIEEEPHCEGNTQYEPRVIVKLFVYIWLAIIGTSPAMPAGSGLL